jgi:hypothetical protein
MTSKHDEDIMYNENGGLVFNPYNENNVEITLSEVQSILQRYGRLFTSNTRNAPSLKMLETILQSLKNRIIVYL